MRLALPIRMLVLSLLTAGNLLFSEGCAEDECAYVRCAAPAGPGESGCCGGVDDLETATATTSCPEGEKWVGDRCEDECAGVDCIMVECAPGVTGCCCLPQRETDTATDTE